MIANSPGSEIYVCNQMDAQGSHFCVFFLCIREVGHTGRWIIDTKQMLQQ